jgi:tetratricopeptide (TPR) repeat protein
MQLDGLAYRLVPISTKTNSSVEKGRIDTDILYDKYMNTFRYGRMNQPDVYMDSYQLRTLSVIQLRFRFARLANALANKGDTTRAEKVLDKIIELAPDKNIPYDVFMPSIAETYYRINKFEKGKSILEKLTDIADRHLKYYYSLKHNKIKSIDEEISYQMRILANAVQIARVFNQSNLTAKYEALFNKYNLQYSILMH